MFLFYIVLMQRLSVGVSIFLLPIVPGLPMGEIGVSYLQMKQPWQRMICIS